MNNLPCRHSLLTLPPCTFCRAFRKVKRMFSRMRNRPRRKKKNANLRPFHWIAVFECQGKPWVAI